MRRDPISYIGAVTLTRLQLAVGSSAVLIEELPHEGPLRIFAARAPHDPPDHLSRLVVLHPEPPAGPVAGALLDRMASIRAVSHPTVVAPLATGAFDAQAWVIEPAPAGELLASRISAGGSLSYQEVIRLLRDLSRALAALHRRGVHHGAIGVDAITLTRDGARLNHLGRSVTGSVADDLQMLGALGQQALCGDSARQRRLAPASLDALLEALAEPGSGKRFATADAVLVALDQFPAGDSAVERGLLGLTGAGARPAGHGRTAMVLAAVAVVFLVVWFVIRLT